MNVNSVLWAVCTNTSNNSWKAISFDKNTRKVQISGKISNGIDAAYNSLTEEICREYEVSSDAL